MPHAAPGRALAAVLLLAAFAAVAQPMYRWVDEKGVTHFSQDPPPDGRKATRIEPRAMAPGKPAPVARDTPQAWKEQEAEFRRRQVERSQREERDERAAGKRAERCSAARQRLALHETQIRVYRRDDKGEKVYYTDEERAGVIREQRDLIRENCD